MKKKIALLLALVMIFTAVPMQALAATSWDGITFEMDASVAGGNAAAYTVGDTAPALAATISVLGITGQTTAPAIISLQWYVKEGDSAAVAEGTLQTLVEAEAVISGAAQTVTGPVPSTATAGISTYYAEITDGTQVLATSDSVTVTVSEATVGEDEYIDFPDPAFKSALLELGIGDGVGITAMQATLVTDLYIANKGISSLDGIEYFTNLQYLDARYNQLTSADFTNNAALLNISCGVNSITEINISKNNILEVLQLGHNKISEVDVSNNPNLKHLEVDNNLLTSLDLTGNANISVLDCSSNSLTSLDLTGNIHLNTLFCLNNKLTSIDLSNNTELVELNCSNNQLKSIDISNNNLIGVVRCSQNNMTSIDDVVGWQNYFSLNDPYFHINFIFDPQNYVITFTDWDGTELKKEFVSQGFSATAPTNPTREGYAFIGWDKNFTNVRSNLTVTAQYGEPISVNVDTWMVGVDSVGIIGDVNITETETGLLNNGVKVQFKLDSPYATLVEDDGLLTRATGTSSAFGWYPPVHVDAAWGGFDYGLELTFRSRETTLGPDTHPATLRIPYMKVAFASALPLYTPVNLQYRLITDGVGDTEKWKNAAGVAMRYERLAELSRLTGRKSGTAKTEAPVSLTSGVMEQATDVILLKDNLVSFEPMLFTVPDGVEISAVHAATYRTDATGGRTRVDGIRKKQGYNILSAFINYYNLGSSGEISFLQLYIGPNAKYVRVMVNGTYYPLTQVGFGDGYGNTYWDLPSPITNLPLGLESIVVSSSDTSDFLHQDSETISVPASSIATTIETTDWNEMSTSDATDEFVNSSGVVVPTYGTGFTFNNKTLSYDGYHFIGNDPDYQVELQFKLNIEEGYAAKYGSEVMLTATDKNGKTLGQIAIATVKDPDTGNPDPTDPDPVDPVIEEELTDILEGITEDTPPEKILEAINGFTAPELEAALKDNTAAATIKDIEDKYLASAKVKVEVAVDNNTHGDFANNTSKISVVGAGLNAAAGQTVSLEFTKPFKNADVNASLFEINNAVQVDINLTGVSDQASLSVPVLITVPIPSGVKEKDFVILHYKDDGTYTVIVPKDNGDGTCSFVVNSFSVFVFTNKVAQATPPVVFPVTPPPSSNVTYNYDYNKVAVNQAVASTKNVATVDKQDGEATIATVNVTVRPNTKGQVNFTVSKATIANVITKAKAFNAKLNKAERADGTVVEVFATAEKDITGMTVRLDKTALQSLSAAGFGLVVYSEASFIELDADAVKELLKTVNSNIRFSVTPVAKQTTDYPAYNVLFKDTRNRNVAELENGVVTFGIYHEAYPNGAGVVEIEKNQETAIPDSSVTDGWLRWTGDANGVFTVGGQADVQQQAPSAEQFITEGESLPADNVPPSEF